MKQYEVVAEMPPPRAPHGCGNFRGQNVSTAPRPLRPFLNVTEQTAAAVPGK